jgi:hypothetical protein
LLQARPSAAQASAQAQTGRLAARLPRAIRERFTPSTLPATARASMSVLC